MKRSLARQFTKILGRENFSLAPCDLRAYSYDASGLSFMPEAVALPTDLEQVVRVMKFANSAGIPVYPRGAGTGTTGGALAEIPGLVLCLSRMNRILSVNMANLTVETEPGAITGSIQAHVEKSGLLYPPDPASLGFCTIGGNVATGAGGARAVKYGVTRDYVMSLQIVLPGGKVVETGTRTAKGVVGYNLARLMVGSEGTLGVITRVLLRLVPAPKAVGTLLAFFPGPSEACKGLVSLFTRGVLPRCAELLDRLSLECVKDSLPVSIPRGTRAMLLAEVDGSLPAVREETQEMASVFQAAGASGLHVAESPEQAARFWKARRSLSPAIRRLGYPDKVSEDICVPRDALPEMMRRLEDAGRRFDITILSFGHAGDGNLHVNLLTDLGQPELKRHCHEAVDWIMEQTLSLGGTVSGEHGTGITKRPYLSMELGADAIGLMKGIKGVFDPRGILNPGKL